jgi:preprotein translocase subunit SecG
MENVVLVIHLFLALALIGLVLIQRSEGGGLGIGGGGGGMGRLATAKGTANLLTRATTILGACFFGTSLLLAILAGQDSKARHGILESAPPAQEQPATPGTEIPQQSQTPPPQ